MNPLDCNRKIRKAKYPNYLCNSDTHRWVNIKSTSGQKIATDVKNNPRPCPPTNKKAQGADYLCNPATGHWVKKEGRVGKLAQRHYLTGYLPKPIIPSTLVTKHVGTSPMPRGAEPTPLPSIIEPPKPTPVPLTAKQALAALKKPLTTNAEKIKFKMPPGYKYVKLINSGLSGIIFSALKISTNTSVVIKRYKDEIEPTTADKMSKRVASLSKLTTNDEYLLHYLDSYYDTSSRVFYLIMDYFDGHNLSQLDIKEMDNAEKAQVILQLILGLYDLHVEHHLSHEDIKPSNIMISNDGGLVKYIGYSLVFDVTSWKSNYNLTSGAPYYRSPENILTKQGQLVMDSDKSLPILQASDIWSLACVIYYVLTGQHAFQKGSEFNIETINYNILAGKPNLSILPAEFRNNVAFMNLLQSMFTVDYASRPNIEQITASYEKVMQGGLGA